MADVKTLSVKCPTCQKPVLWNESSRFRPFCSERCKLIDLGEWASEGHKIEGNNVYDDLMNDELDRDH